MQEKYSWDTVLSLNYKSLYLEISVILVSIPTFNKLRNRDATIIQDEEALIKEKI